MGSKAPRGQVARLIPGEPTDRASWRIQTLCAAEWIMSLLAADVDGDGDLDIVLADRKGPASGVYWLERPDAAHDTAHDTADAWPRHLIGGLGAEVMFAGWLPETDGELALAVAVKPREIRIYRPTEDVRAAWREEIIQVEPAEALGTAKSVVAADLDGDGNAELVFSCEHAQGDRSGVVYLKQVSEDQWKLHDLGGPQGTKFDLLELVDIDGDGFLDILTCEEQFQDSQTAARQAQGLGVVWYRNPFGDSSE